MGFLAVVLEQYTSVSVAPSQASLLPNERGPPKGAVWFVSNFCLGREESDLREVGVAKGPPSLADIETLESAALRG
jgi:hypothetical protein